MPDDLRHPEPPSDDEIEARLRRAVERSFSVPPEELEKEEDIEARFRKLQQELAGQDLPDLPDAQTPRRPALPEDDPSFAAQLQSLHDRAEGVKTAREQASRQQARSHQQDQKNAMGLGLGLSIAYMFLGFPLVGVLIGWGINRATGATFWLPVLGFVGMLAGCVLAFQALNRVNKNL
ncbi:AtpZ/AtpI family protein [Fimbriimonas ginsengisoli]|uniref:ATP synthase protein I n=1 Tax=Fimbriimonas ginsengisoli Gsoil 348 TaxID=661478 RepID=A0A068NXQ3_FIMGI|nr:AtpZ/AtpI family protein [Fimbriimonas ginsengisoli]AIE88112.1 hypothetical protein OP10G_4744 [Fimbriimonas ginsengisoli Gsoil 348]